MTALLPARRYSCPAAEGAIYHHGAHVVDWTPAGHQPVLWMSPSTNLNSESAIRGGVPIGWPWFGAGPDGMATPLHGFARLTEWRLVDTEETAETSSATYLLIDARPDKFEFPYRLFYRVSFGRELSVTLTVRNTGTRRFTFEEALLAYLKIGDVRRITVTGLDRANYLDRVPGNDLGPHPQVGELTFTREIDRIYHSKTQIQVADPVLKRRIILTRTGSQDAVIWNPWAEKSETVPDLGEGEWLGMIGIGTANVAEHAITVNPGKEHVIGFTLRVAPFA